MRNNPYAVDSATRWRPLIAVAGWLASTARSRRYDRFLRTMRPMPSERLLDVGCGQGWSLADLDPDADVTGVDIVPRAGFDRPNQSFVVADACDLPFANRTFDIAYSNSLIEHIAPERRPGFARELTRVAKRYWVQTPNRYFPLEPHALLPCVQFLPPICRRAAWKLSPRRIGYEESLRLLSRNEMYGLFDDAILLEERVGPFVKSLIAIGPRSSFRLLSSG